MSVPEEQEAPVGHDRVYLDDSVVEVRIGGKIKAGRVIAFNRWKNEYQVSFETGYNGTDNPYSEWFHADNLTATE